MTELEAVIEPEAVPPTPSPRRRLLAVLVGVTVLAVVAGGIAVAAGAGRSEPKLALMAGNGAGSGAETMAARTAGPAPAVAPAQGAADSKAAVYPYGGWGMKFEVDGRLPDLPDHAAAWRVDGPSLDRATVARVAGALGLTGDPVQRDGGWFVDSGEWTLNAYGGDAFGEGGPWSINLFRSHPDRRPDDPAGPAISPAEAERRVHELLDAMGAPRSSWKVETTATEIGTAWGCAAPAPPISPEELTKLEADKLRQVERENAAASGTTASGTAASSGTTDASGTTAASGTTGGPAPTPAAKPLPADAVASCPPPPAPVKGFSVALYPVLDGHRADWPVWNMTLRSDGGIEGLYGSWVTFERADNYKLRGVDAALKDLQSTPVAYATDLPARPAVEPAIAHDVAPCPPIPVPDGKAVSSPLIGCAPPEPQVVKITGVELGLMQTSVFEDGRVRLAMVPSYRFIGHFANGSPWSTSVIALHPDAIAPPPEFVVTDDLRGGGGGATGVGVGQAVPPSPPTAEPAPVKQ